MKMKKLFGLLLCSAMIVLGAMGTVAFADTLDVGADKTYATLNDAYQAAKAGDVIEVYEGAYTIGDFTVAKSVSVIGIGTEKPVLNGRFYVELASGNFNVENVEIKIASDALQIRNCADATVSVKDCIISELTAQGINVTGSVKDVYLEAVVFKKKSSNVVAFTSESGTVTGTLTMKECDASNAGRTAYLGKVENAYFENNTQGYTKVKLLNDIGTLTFSGAGAGVGDWTGKVDEIILEDGAVLSVPAKTGFKAIVVDATDGTETFYYTLQNAVDAAEAGDIVVLNDNITAEILPTADTTSNDANALVHLDKDDEITLDLNGKTISVKGSDEAKFDTLAIRNNGVLTITDTSSAKNGKITLAFDGTNEVGSSQIHSTILNFGTLTIENGTIENTATTGYSPYAIYNYSWGGNAILTINGGTVSSDRTYAVIQAIYDDFSKNNNFVTVNGGTINGGLYSWYQGACLAASLEINGGKFVAGASTEALRVRTSGSFGIPLSISDDAEFEGEVRIQAVASLGGKIYASLQAAVDAADDTDYEIAVLSDIELTAQNAQPLFKPVYNRESYAGLIIPDDKKIVIDLCGYTVSYVDEYFEVDNVMILNLGNLTVNDSVGDGLITYKPVKGSSTYSKFYSTVFNCGTLTVNAGTVENTAEEATDVTNAVDNHSRLSHEYGNDSVLVVNGGTLIGAEYRAIRQYTHYLEGVKNRVEINGGVIKGGIYMQHGDSWYYADPTQNRLNVNCELEINGGTITTIECADGTSYGHIRSYLNNPDNAKWSIEIKGGTIEVPVQLQVQKGYRYSEDGMATSGTLITGEAAATRNTEWLEKNGGFITGGTFKTVGDVNNVATNLASFLDDAYTLIEGGIGYVAYPKAELVETITVEFADVTDANARGEKLYNINLVADNSKTINRLNSADLTFALTQISGNNAYEIVDIADDKIAVNNVEGDRYEFHFETKTDVTNDTANTITIAQVKVTGYGKYSFAVKEADTNAAHATQIYDNIVDTFIPDGSAENEGILDIGTGTGEVEIFAPTQNLTIKVSFPNAIANNTLAYQAMNVLVTGEDITDISIDLGTDNTGKALTLTNKTDAAYTVSFDEASSVYTIVITNALTANTAYNVTVSGAGYRTTKYTVNTQETDKVLNFWNNVKDNALEVEEGKTTSAKTVTYLAGDIVKDGTINVYDLSAVVSYFGEIDLNVAGTANTYAKYDLNRDGKIDSKDVAYVLVSWGK